MGQMIVRLKNGGYWDPMILRFVWWVLDGEPIMETMEGVVLDYSIPSIEQVGFAASLFKNCTFKYENDAFKRVMEWSNSMKLKSMFHREKQENSRELYSSVVSDFKVEFNFTT